MSSSQVTSFKSDNQDPESIFRKIQRLLQWVFFFLIRSNDQDMSFSPEEVQIFDYEANHYNLVIEMNQDATGHEIFTLYFQAHHLILQGKSKEGKQMVKDGQRLAKTSKKNDLYKLLLDSPYARVHYMEKNEKSLNDLLRECFQKIDALGRGVPGSILGWLYYMNAQAKTDRSAAIKDFELAIDAFNRSETMDKLFGKAHALCRLIICRLGCGETADTVERVFTPNPQEMQKVDRHFEDIDSMAIKDANIVIGILYFMARSDYEYRNRKFEMAVTHAKTAHQLVDKHNCNEFLEATMQREHVYTRKYKEMATDNQAQTPESQKHVVIQEGNRNTVIITSDNRLRPTTLPLIEVHDSESAGMDSGRLENEPENLTLKGILQGWVRKTLVHSQKTIMLVHREDLLKSTQRIVRRDNFNFCHEFKTIFSGEDGVDFGGPKREFLRLLMKEVRDECFQGHKENMFFLHDLDKLLSNTYEMVGSLVAFSLLHGGPGLPVLHDSLYDLLLSGKCDSLPPVDQCVFDVDRRLKFEAIMHASNQEEYSAAFHDVSEWAADQGLSIYKYRQLEEKDNLLDLLKKNEIFDRVHSEIDQFKNGLNKVGLFFDTTCKAPEEFRNLFVHQDTKLSFSSLRSTYHVNFSPEGSNDRRSEGSALYCLEAFLVDCEEGRITGVTLQDVFCFWTGACSLPPLGFHKELEISFGTDKRLPSAHTCSLILNMWKEYSDPDAFAEDMVKAVTWGGGFHLA